MGRFVVEQLSQSSGELDPELHSRKDTTHFYNGAKRLRNVFVKPQGGWRRRDGQPMLARHPRKLEELHLDVTGITVTALNGGTAADMIDDTTSTGMTTTGTMDTTNPFGIWKVDLGEAKKVMFIDLQSTSLSVVTADGPDADQPYSFAIEFSDDDSVWTLADNGEIRVLDAVERDWRLRVDATHRYWRLVKVSDEDFTGAALTVRELRFWQESETEVSAEKCIGFSFSDTQRYKIVLSDRNAAIFKDRTHVADVMCPDLFESYIDGLNWTQTLDTLLLFHRSAQTMKIERKGYDEAWSQVLVAYDNIPPIDWEDQDTSAISIALSATTGVAVTATASGGAPFTSAMVGWAIEYIPGAGYARITGFTSTTIVTVRILNAFGSTAIETGEWKLLEPAWSNARGWPQCGKVGKGRLWVGGTNLLPANGWGSRSNLFFDFDNGGDEADMGLAFVCDADDVATIYDFMIGKHIEIFTEAGEFFLLPGDEVIKPTNIAQDNPTSVGMKGPGLKPVRIEGATLFPQREGKAIREFILAESVNETYTAENVSLLASHLIRDPVDVGLRKTTSTEEADLYAVVNGDGTLATFLTLRTQGVNAWALQRTNGTYRSVGADKELFFVVERPDGEKYVEVFDRERFLDNSVRYDVNEVPGLTISGLGRFNGQSVALIIDGLVESNITVSGGEIELPRSPSNFIEIGYDFPNVNDVEDEDDPRFGDVFGVWVRLMPADVNPDSGQSLVGLPKRVVDADVQCLDTAAFYVGANDGELELVSFREFGPNLLGQPLATFSGTVRLRGLLGVSQTGNLDIVQKEPVALSVTGITRRLAV